MANEVSNASRELNKIKEQFAEERRIWYERRAVLRARVEEAELKLSSAKIAARAKEREARNKVIDDLTGVREWVIKNFSSSTLHRVSCRDLRESYELYIGKRVHKPTFNSILFSMGLKQKVARLPDGVLARVWYRPEKDN